MPADAPRPDEISSLGTKTHPTGEGAKEVVTVTVPVTYVGSQQVNAPNPYEGGFGGEMRCSYYLMGPKVGVQLPRWSNEFHKFTVKAPLSDVVYDESGTITSYYKLDDSFLVITWNMGDDSWTWEEQDIEDYDAHIDADSVIWSAVRRSEQVV